MDSFFINNVDASSRYVPDRKNNSGQPKKSKNKPDRSDSDEDDEPAEGEDTTEEKEPTKTIGTVIDLEI